MGSQDLFSVSFFFQSLAGIIGCIIAAFMMENYHPRWAFLIYGVFGFLLGILCFFLNSEAEKEVAEDYLISEYSSEIMDGQTPSEALRLR